MPASVDPGPPTVFRADDGWPALLAERLDALERHPEAVRAVDARAAADTLLLAATALARHAAGEQPERVGVERDVLVLRRLGVRVTGAGALETVDERRASGDRGPVDRRTAAPEASGPDEGLVEASLRQRTWATLRERAPQLRALEALALALQEDLVVIARGGPGEADAGRHGPDAAPDACHAGSGRAVWLHVAFPSGWDPGAMAGASFEHLHAPVPDATPLRRAAPALVHAMLSKGPFVRYVWGLSPDGARSRHPRHAAPMAADHPLDAAWLRVERQTTLPLPEADAALFAIGVHVTPLSSALADPGRRAAFADAVASLTPALRRYKGVPWDDATVRRWCDALE